MASTIGQAARIPASKRKALAAALLAAMLAAYTASIRMELRNRGYGDRQIAVNDPEVLAKLRARADEQALSCIIFTNQLLRRALDALPADASDESRLAAIEAVLDEARTYNANVLAPLMTRWAAGQAVADFTTKNLSEDVQWECSPGYTTSLDNQCDCPAAIDASPMSYDEALAFDMPSHPNCIHTMRPIILSTYRWPDSPWTGEIEEPAEAA